MAKKTKTAAPQKKKNPQDATLRNVRAATARAGRLERMIKLMQADMQHLLRRVRRLEMTGRDVPDDDPVE